MATVQKFLDEQEKARMDVLTAQRRVRESCDKAQASLNDGKIDRLDTLVDKDVKEGFVNTLASGLVEPHKEAVEALQKSSLSAEETIMYGEYGFTAKDSIAFIDEVKENFTLDGFMKYLSEKTGFQDAMKRKAQRPLKTLDEVPAEDILAYAGIEARNPSLMTLPDKAELIGYAKQQEEQQEQLDKFLKGKPYM